jgi:hypothetical protein
VGHLPDHNICSLGGGGGGEGVSLAIEEAMHIGGAASASTGGGRSG